MSDAYKTILLIPAYNEAGKIERALRRIPAGAVETVLVIDDGSTDGTASAARELGAKVISLGRVRGVGAALREGLAFARNTGHDLAVVMAGNDKDDPREIPLLTAPICSGEADFVIGSRFLQGGRYGGDMPLYRKIATRVHPFLLGLFTRRRISESTNGFRAFRLSLLDDPRINMNQSWLDGYGLEVYMLFKVLRLGIRHREVPCTKVYPSRRVGNTKIKPIVGWWDLLKPICLLGLGLRT